MSATACHDRWGGGTVENGKREGRDTDTVETEDDR